MSRGPLELPALPAQRSELLFTRKRIQAVLHKITAELKTRGLRTPHVFLPFRSRMDDGKLDRFLAEILPAIDLQSDAVISKTVAQTDEFTLVSALKYFWCRLPNSEIVGWDVYLEFRRKEAAAGYPKDAFLTIMPKCLLLAAHASIVYDFLDLLIGLTSNSQHNHLNGRKIAKMAALWAFNRPPTSASAFYDATIPQDASFLDGLAAWKETCNGLFHLLLAFLRAMLPDTGTETLNLPKTLQSLLISNTYPPPDTLGGKLVITIPCVHVRSTVPSANPYELISKVRHSLLFEHRDSFLSIENYTILKNIFQHASTSDIVATFTEESRRVLSRLTADPVHPSGSIYPGWARASALDQPLPLYSEVSITSVTLQDYFIWTWLLSLGSDQSHHMKTLFGRSIVVEAGLRGFQKWIVMTETSISDDEYRRISKTKGPLPTSVISPQHRNLQHAQMKQDLPPIPQQELQPPESRPVPPAKDSTFADLKFGDEPLTYTDRENQDPRDIFEHNKYSHYTKHVHPEPKRGPRPPPLELDFLAHNTAKTSSQYNALEAAGSYPRDHEAFDSRRHQDPRNQPSKPVDPHKAHSHVKEPANYSEAYNSHSVPLNNPKPGLEEPLDKYVTRGIEQLNIQTSPNKGGQNGSQGYPYDQTTLKHRKQQDDSRFHDELRYHNGDRHMELQPQPPMNNSPYPDQDRHMQHKHADDWNYRDQNGNAQYLPEYAIHSLGARDQIQNGSEDYARLEEADYSAQPEKTEKKKKKKKKKKKSQDDELDAALRDWPPVPPPAPVAKDYNYSSPVPEDLSSVQGERYISYTSSSIYPSELVSRIPYDQQAQSFSTSRAPQELQFGMSQQNSDRAFEDSTYKEVTPPPAKMSDQSLKAHYKLYDAQGGHNGVVSHHSGDQFGSRTFASNPSFDHMAPTSSTNTTLEYRSREKFQSPQKSESNQGAYLDQNHPPSHFTRDRDASYGSNSSLNYAKDIDQPGSSQTHVNSSAKMQVPPETFGQNYNMPNKGSQPNIGEQPQNYSSPYPNAGHQSNPANPYTPSTSNHPEQYAGQAHHPETYPAQRQGVPSQGDLSYQNYTSPQMHQAPRQSSPHDKRQSPNKHSNNALHQPMQQPYGLQMQQPQPIPQPKPQVMHATGSQQGHNMQPPQQVMKQPPSNFTPPPQPMQQPMQQPMYQPPPTGQPMMMPVMQGQPMQPGMMQPGMMQPGMMQPSYYYPLGYQPQVYGTPPQGYPVMYMPPPNGYQPPALQQAKKPKPTTSELTMMNMPSANTFKKNQRPDKAGLRAALNQGAFGI